ncbi:MAG: ABC transporter permease, partial [Micromonosporaceae bacterium]
MAYDGLSERTQRIDGWPETGGDEPVDSSRDRLGIHGIWEGVLAVLVVLVAIVAYQINADSFGGGGTPGFLLAAAALGFVTAGTAWSVRAAVPNLATGPIAATAAVFFIQQSAGGLGFGVGVTLAAAATLGVVLAIVVVALHVPAWAVTLAAGLALAGWYGTPARSLELPEEITYAAKDHALYWFVGFAAISLLGGLISLLGPFRRAAGAYRPSGDPAERPGFNAGLSALAALVGSSVLAALGGVLTALTLRVATPDPGIATTALALGAVLIGGTSLYGRRGGLFGTVLAVVLVTVGLRLIVVEGWRVPPLAYGAVAILIGLLVTRLVETLGRRRRKRAPALEEWSPADRGLPPGGMLALPAGPAGGV